MARFRLFSCSLSICLLGIIFGPATGECAPEGPVPLQACIYSISPTGVNYTSGSESGTVQVITSPGCPWSAVSNVSWIHITSGTSGAGDGVVAYIVEAMDSPCTRTGTLTIAGLKFTVTQMGPVGCIFSLSPTTASHGPGAESGTITVTQQYSACSWKASTADSWISIVSGTSGEGNGRVVYQLSPNPSTQERTGKIRIYCSDVTIIQKGRSATMPAISGVNPTTVTAGGPAFELTVTGSNFLPGAQVLWNDRGRPTTFIGVAQLRASIEAADIPVAQSARITVFNPPGDVSDAALVTVAPATNPYPSITALSPRSWTKEGTGFRLTVQGRSFVPASKVLWNGAERATTYEGRSQLSALILPTDVKLAGKWRVSVTNPPPGGGESEPAVLEVVSGICITGLSPMLAPYGSNEFKLTVFGNNLVGPPIAYAGGNAQTEAPKVLWNGQALPTTVVNDRQVEATVPAYLVGSQGTANVTVAYTTGGSSNSIPIPIAVENPVPLIEGVNPGIAAPGTGQITLTLEGKNFVRESKVLWNGTSRTTRFTDSTNLQADIPATDTVFPGTSTLTVLNPAPGGGESNRQEFTFVRTLYFPRLANRGGSSPVSDADEYTGVAIANLDAAPATLTFTALNAAGDPPSGTGVTNPARMPAEAGRQLALLDHQIFGPVLDGQDSPGWFKMESNGNRVAGFFLMFDASLKVLDGADVSGNTAKEWILPEIEGLGFTQIHAANPGIEPARVMFELYGPDGKLKMPATVRNLNPGGSLCELVSGLFPGSIPSSADYLRAVSDRSVLVFEYLGQKGKYVEGLNGRDPVEGSTILYSPQYAVGGPDWRTTLTVVNLSERSGTVTFRFIREDGVQIGATKALEIAARGKIHVSDQKFFLDAGSVLRQGYVEVTSDGIQLAGSTVFGDPAQDRFSSALPLLAGLGTDLLFSQLASDDLYFTGLAILNPGTSAVSAVVEVFDSNGARLGTRTENIGAKQRRSGVLTEWFPELKSVKLAKGYIRVRANGGVATFALFGTQNLSALSAVPAQPVP